MSNIEKFIRLYKKFIDGMRWLNSRKLKGIETSQDEADFERDIASPMNEIFSHMTESEKKSIDAVTEVVWGFTGEIILEETRGIFINLENPAEDNDSPLCPACGEPGDRFCLGFTGKSSKWGLFCLKCEPFSD